MPHTVTATIEVVTPLFLGGADPARTVELRAPSIKGVLRFWWRSLAWSRHGGDLNTIQKEEQEIFGTAGDDRGSLGQSSFGLRTRWLQESVRLAGTEPRSLTSSRPGASYLGYGIINRGQGNPPRPCYEPAGRFELTLLAFKRNQGKPASTKVEAELHPSLLDAVKLFGLLGGLGGRSRRGWGSVMLTGMDNGWSPPEDLAGYRDELAAILGGTAGAPEAPYSGFGKGARLHVFGVGADALAVLDQLGQAYQAFRREPGNRSFIFGLPHSRFKGDAERRASPLLFHVHKLKDQYAVAATFLRAPFLEHQPCWNEYKKIESFLDRLPATLRTNGLMQTLNVLSGSSSQ